MTSRISGKMIALFAVAVLAVATIALARAGGSDAAHDASSDSWSTVASKADGQTVKLWMWGGEDALNRYIDDEVMPAAAAAGVQLIRVPVDDTA